MQFANLEGVIAFEGYYHGMTPGFAALNFREKNHLPEHAMKLSEHMLKRLREIGEQSRYIGDVCGRGLMIGIEFVEDKNAMKPAENIARDIRKSCYRKGLIVELSGQRCDKISYCHWS